MAPTTDNTPDPTTVELRGHEITITYRRGWQCLYARIEFPPALLPYRAKLEKLEFYPDVAYDGREYVVVEGGVERASGPWLDMVALEYSDLIAYEYRTQTQESARERLAGLRVEAEKLQLAGLPTGALFAAIDECERRIDNVDWKPGSTSHERVSAQLHRIRRLIGDLNGPFIEVVVRGLIKGGVGHKDVARNEMLRDRLLNLWIRSGGLVYLLTDELLAAHYRKCLAGASDMTQVAKASLVVDESDYVPGRMLKEAELAPEWIAIPQNGRPHVTVDVVYELRKVGTVQVPIATATMSLAQYRRATSIPKLPHGITLVLKLTIEGKVVAEGAIGDELEERANKVGKARARGQNGTARIKATGK